MSKETGESEPKKIKALFVNGSPRKNNNTAQMLESAMKGAAEAGAEVTLVHLYDLKFTGCKSCFACQLKNAKTDGVCIVRDDLRSVLELAHEANVIVVGSPVYFGYPSGETRSFLERLLFPHYTYHAEGRKYRPIVPKHTAMIFTMNCPDGLLDRLNYHVLLDSCADQLRFMFGQSEILYSTDTYQFSDYSRYAASMFDEESKRHRHEEQFPIDLQNAYELGKRLVEMENTK